MKTAHEQALTMPAMLVAPSVLPALQGKRDAWVFFAPTDISKGTIVATICHITKLCLSFQTSVRFFFKDQNVRQCLPRS